MPLHRHVPLALGPALRTLRTERNISMAELHRRTGIARSYLYLIEDGETANPKRDYLNRIALVLNIEPEELYDLAWQTTDQADTPHLPPLATYLRHKYNFNDEQVAIVDRAFKRADELPPRPKQRKGGPT